MKEPVWHNIELVCKVEAPTPSPGLSRFITLGFVGNMGYYG